MVRSLLSGGFCEEGPSTRHHTRWIRPAPAPTGPPHPSGSRWCGADNQDRGSSRLPVGWRSRETNDIGYTNESCSWAGGRGKASGSLKIIKDQTKGRGRSPTKACAAPRVCGGEHAWHS